MRKRIFLQCMSALAILTVGWLGWQTISPRSERSTEAGATSAEAVRGAVTSEARMHAWRSRDSGQHEQTSPRPLRAVRAGTKVKVDAHYVLAMVNQTPLQLKNLMPIGPGETQKELSRQQYRSRLQRAIEMELIFQEASAQGVALTEVQQQRLEQLALRGESDLEHYQQYGLSWSSSTAEQVQFESRVLEAQMLEQNLVAQSAGAAPSPNPEIQASYEQARSKMFDELNANADISEPGPAL